MVFKYTHIVCDVLINFCSSDDLIIGWSLRAMGFLVLLYIASANVCMFNFLAFYTICAII